MCGWAKLLLAGASALWLSTFASGVAANPATVPVEPHAASDPFPAVPELRPQVDFWIEVFSRLHQNQVVLHDTRHPQLRYEVFTLPGNVDDGLNREQSRYLDARKKRLSAQLESLERKHRRGEPLTPSEEELLRLLEAAAGIEALRGAAQRLRAQRGLQERFLAGVRRSGRYLAQMRRIFAEEGLPQDLALLPHVESSFNIEARSTAGAAGIWQFTRTTGRRFLHMSDALDERLDPIAATRGAAAYLRTAHELLGDWALAITSYNHGLTGVLRAARRHGHDLARIVREYDSDSFGFASGNFYTEFLAVREIISHPERHLAEPLRFDAPLQLESLRLPRPTSATRLARLLDTDIVSLAAVNPAWLDKALQGKVALPANIRVWLPRGIQFAGTGADAQLQVAERNAPPLPVLDGQARKELYRVRAGDTLGAIARREGVSVAELRSMNGIRSNSHHIRVGQKLKLPVARTETRRTAAKAGVHLVRDGENPFIIARRYKVPLSSLLAENGLVQDAIIHPGQRLRIPAKAKP